MKLTGKIVDQGLKAFTEKIALHQGRRQARIWIIVADDGVAKIFRKQDGHLEHIGEALPEITEQGEVRNKGLGRIASGAGSTIRQKFEPHMESSRQQALCFVYDFMDWLDRAEEMDVFDRLVIVAAPRTLGDLRAVMSKPVQGRIAAEIDKDLTHLSETALREALDKILWF